MECHNVSTYDPDGTGGVALVGHPNVGKSALFQCLTGQRALVSNYPGTTVSITRGRMTAYPDIELVDTPGLITIPTLTEDEHVTARVLLEETPQILLQVGDAKNLRRSLLLTVQLAEMGLPLILALNMTDEARKYGYEIDARALEAKIRVPIVLTSATRGEGISELLGVIENAVPASFRIKYPQPIETALKQVTTLMPGGRLSRRSQALLWLSADKVYYEWLQPQLAKNDLETLQKVRVELLAKIAEAPASVIQQTRLSIVDRFVATTLRKPSKRADGLGGFLGRIAMHHIWGWFVLSAILYGLYWFVGVFGAGTLVDYLESHLFGAIINPWLTNFLQETISSPFILDFFVGEYGVWTIGMTYALALILPIVTTFFLAFGLLEDSGYLPRLVALSNRAFQTLGLNGKAVLPMVLGLGCVTMATLTTRVLESKRERVLVTLLLALAVPCSAQLGVVMGLLAGISFTATVIWCGVVLIVLLVVGWLAAKLVPGDRTPLLIELPPLRFPQVSNVVLKTLARLEWYLKEVIPLFLIGAAVMFTLDWLGLLDWLGTFMQPLVVHWLGLPVEATTAFLMGFLRRDFGATGLFVMEAQGLLSPLQVVVSMVTITLFIPCVASVLIIAKEHGRKAAAGMVILIFPLAFFIAGVLYRILEGIGWMMYI